MKTWFRGYRHGDGLDLEAELRKTRPTPSTQFVKSIAARVNPRPANPVRTRSRIAIAGVATAAMVAAVGASGGFSSAASSIAGAAKSVASSTHATSPGPSHLPGAPGPDQTIRGSGSPSAAAQYHLAPTITSFSPEIAAPGATINLLGTNFTGFNAVTDVLVNGTEAAFSVSSATTLSFVVPSGATSGPITVENGTLPNAVSADSLTVVVAPHITSLDNTEGGGGTPVTVTGTGFIGTKSVTIGGKSATFNVVSGTEIDTAVPATAKVGAGFLVVTNAVGSDQTAYTVDSGAPKITSLNPQSATTGTLMAVKGTNLDTATDLLFAKSGGGTTDAAVVGVPTKTQANFTVPADAVTGDVTVLNASGQATSPKAFIVIGAATVSSFSPAFGKAGTSVVITGTSFTGATGVSFGGQDAGKITVKGDTQITAKVPAGAPSGLVHLVVTNGNGAGPSSATQFDVLTAVPTVSSAAPGTGGAGTSVAIGGSNFTGASKVTFNGKPASYSVVDNTHITATVPAGAPTSGAGLVVSNAVGASAPFAFTVLSTAPTVASAMPQSGAVNDEITIKGTHLDTVTDVVFGGGGDATPPYVQQTTDGKLLVVKVPAGAVSGTIVVTNPSGSATTKSFTVIAAPVIVGFTPAYAKSPGTKVTIVGVNLFGANEVDFAGGVSAKPIYNAKDGSLSVVVPKNAASGVLTVKVHSPGGQTFQGDSGSSTLTIVVKPSGIAGPATAARGATISLTGAGFTGVSQVKVGTISASFHVTDDGHMSVTIPANAKTGKGMIAIGNAAGTASFSLTIT